MFQDGIDGSLSSKRVVTFLAFLLCAIAFIANLFWGYKVETFMYEGMIYLAMAGLGVTVAEKFSSRSNATQTTESNSINRIVGKTPLPKQEDKLI